MVAIPEAEQQAAATTSTDDWESMTKEEQVRFATAKFDEGKSNYIKMDFPNAADALALALEVKCVLISAISSQFCSRLQHVDLWP